MELFLPLEIKNQEISVPDKITKIFGKIGIELIPSSKIVKGKEVKLDYQQIIGEDIKGIPWPRIEIGKGINQESFSNEFNSLKRNKKVIDEIAKEFKIPKKHQYTKHLMLNGATLPIKLTFESLHGTDIVYAKKANFRRLIGNFLYNIVSNDHISTTKYNNELILETSLNGKLVSNIDERAYLASNNYCEGIGRIAAICDYLGILPDISQPKNRLVTTDEKTKLFDFDGIFFNNEYQNSSNPIFQFYYNFKGKNWINKAMLNGFKHEQKQIAKRLEDKIELIDELSKQAGELNIGNGKKLNENMIQLYGEEDLLNYTKQKIIEYKQ